VIRVVAACLVLGACAPLPPPLPPPPVIAPVTVQARTFCQVPDAHYPLVVELVTSGAACAAIGGVPTEPPARAVPRITGAMP
jgi:hypothetical protein